MNEAPRKNRVRSVFSVAALTAAVGGGYLLHGAHSVIAQNDGTSVVSAPVVQTAASRDAASIQKAFQDVAKQAEPAVVTIVTEGAVRRTASQRSPGNGPGQRNAPARPNPFGGGGEGDPFEDFFRQFQRDFGFTPNSARKQTLQDGIRLVQQDRRGGGGLGSGMIFRSDGLVLTNAHVVRGAETVTVQMNDGREFRRAKVLGSDERTDIAVVKVNATGLPTVKFADSADVEVGDWAIAVGNPYGLAHTVTVGIISAKAREVNIDPRSPGDYLQTDASINPGNSGGPLMDITGRVIGVNNAIYSQSGGNVGIGFAIPINTARNIADRLLRDGKIVRGYLGVRIDSIETQQEALTFGFEPDARGVRVEKVDENTPASRAGLKVGDLITSFNGQKVTRAADLQRLVNDAPANAQVRLNVLRGGQNITVTVTLSPLPAEEGAAGTSPSRNTPAPDNDATAPSLQGLRLRSITPQLEKRYNLQAGTRGVVIVAVDENSNGAEAGFQVGDVIERVGQTPVATPAEAQAAATRILTRQAEGDKSVAIYVNTKGTRRTVILNAD